MLKKTYVRDGNSKVIASETTGYSDESSVVRDSSEHILGRTSERFNTTRDSHGGLVSNNTADAGLLINRKK